MERKQDWKQLDDVEKNRVIRYYNLCVDRNNGKKWAQQQIDLLWGMLLNVNIIRLCGEIMGGDNFCVAHDNHGYAYRLDMNPSSPNE